MLVRTYIFSIVRSSSYIKMIGSGSRSHDQSAFAVVSLWLTDTWLIDRHLDWQTLGWFTDTWLIDRHLVNWQTLGWFTDTWLIDRHLVNWQTLGWFTDTWLIYRHLVVFRSMFLTILVSLSPSHTLNKTTMDVWCHVRLM